MTNLWSENGRRLMSKYKFKVDTDSNNVDLLCSLCSNLMIDAYQSHCGCQYCHVCLAEYLANEEKYCQGGKEDCLEEYLMIEKNVSRSSILDKKVSKVRVHCPNEPCESITELKEMEEHLKTCKHRHIECPYIMVGCCTEGASNNKIMTHLNDDKLVHSQLLIGLFNNLKDEFSVLREIQRNERTEGANLKRRMTTEIELLKEELKRAKTMLTTVRPSVATFTVDSFSVRKTSEEEMLSPCFYSHTNGYKLRLCVFPGGYGEFRGSHLLVFVNICEGKYDDVLPWPCRRSFTLSIINQSDGGTHSSETFDYDTTADEYKHAFEKPIDKEDDEYGSPKFTSFAELQSVVGLVVNDSVIIQCIVSDLV